jgi:hypothetical protein
MACDIIHTDRAVFALWGKPSSADLERVVSRVEMVALGAGQPVVYITRVPSAAPPPDSDVRAQLNEMMPRFVKVCASYHVLLEGDGFLSALKRGILASLLQFGWRNGTFFVHQDMKEVLLKVERGLRPDAQAILDLAARGGLLSAPPPLDVERERGELRVDGPR